MPFIVVYSHRFCQYNLLWLRLTAVRHPPHTAQPASSHTANKISWRHQHNNNNQLIIYFVGTCNNIINTECRYLQRIASWNLRSDLFLFQRNWRTSSVDNGHLPVVNQNCGNSFQTTLLKWSRNSQPRVITISLVFLLSSLVILLMADNVGEKCTCCFLLWFRWHHSRWWHLASE